MIQPRPYASEKTLLQLSSALGNNLPTAKTSWNNGDFLDFARDDPTVLGLRRGSVEQASGTAGLSSNRDAMVPRPFPSRLSSRSPKRL